jgi:hypothetical protein
MQKSPFPTPTTPAVGSQPIPEWPQFTREKGLEIPGISISGGEGTVVFEPSKKAQSLRVRINGTVPWEQRFFVTSGMSTIRIAPRLRVPVSYFTGGFPGGPVVGGIARTNYKLEKVNVDGKLYSVMKQPVEADHLTFESAVEECPLPKSEKAWIVAGDAGAVLHKRGKALFLVEGAAHLEQ